MPDSLKHACSVLLFLLATGTLAQTNTTPHHFVWNSKTFVELDYKHTIQKSKDLLAAERTALVDTISAQLRHLWLIWKLLQKVSYARLPPKAVTNLLT
jgi:hypothetical protein